MNGGGDPKAPSGHIATVNKNTMEYLQGGQASLPAGGRPMEVDQLHAGQLEALPRAMPDEGHRRDDGAGSAAPRPSAPLLAGAGLDDWRCGFETLKATGGGVSPDVSRFVEMILGKLETLMREEDARRAADSSTEQLIRLVDELRQTIAADREEAARSRRDSEQLLERIAALERCAARPSHAGRARAPAARQSRPREAEDGDERKKKGEVGTDMECEDEDFPLLGRDQAPAEASEQRSARVLVFERRRAPAAPAEGGGEAATDMSMEQAELGRDDVIDFLERCEEEIDPQTVKAARDGRRVVVTCGSYADVLKIKSCLQRNADGPLQARSPIDRGAVFVVKGVDTSKNEEKMEQIMRQQNRELFADPETDTLEVLKVRDNGWNGKKSVLLRAKGGAAKKLRESGWIRADYQQSRVELFIEVEQCFVCSSYGHRARSDRDGMCRNEPRCLVCAGGHSRRDCEHKKTVSKHRCACCAKEGKPEAESCHRANSGRCPIRAAYLSSKRVQLLNKF